MNKFDFINSKPSELLDLFLKEYNKLFKIDVEKAIKYIKTQQLFNELTEKWYELEEIDLNKAYQVYNHDYYFTDMFNCYKCYSRTYLNILYKKKINNKHLYKNETDEEILKNRLIEDKTFYERYKNDIKGVLDIGCGCGFTCLHLKQIFKKCNICGVNLKDTYQYKFCKQLDFNLYNEYTKINKKIDLIFASEFFEHIEKPIELVEKLINKFNPKFIITANAFNTKSIGHFSNYIVSIDHYNKYKIKKKSYYPSFSSGSFGTYIYNTHNKKNIDYETERVVPSEDISKMFNKFMRDYGYSKLKTTYFNHRPYVWIKNEHEFVNKTNKDLINICEELNIKIDNKLKRDDYIKLIKDKRNIFN